MGKRKHGSHTFRVGACTGTEIAGSRSDRTQPLGLGSGGRKIGMSDCHCEIFFCDIVTVDLSDGLDSAASASLRRVHRTECKNEYDNDHREQYVGDETPGVPHLLEHSSYLPEIIDVSASSLKGANGSLEETQVNDALWFQEKRLE